MVGQRSPASRRKRFRFLVFRVVASNSRRLMFVKSETASSMSPFGGESRRNWWTVEDLAGFETVASIDEADKSLKINEILKSKFDFTFLSIFERECRVTAKSIFVESRRKLVQRAAIQFRDLNNYFEIW